MTLDEKIGEKLRAARAAATVSRFDAATLIGVSELELKQFETGARRLSAERLHRAAQAFGVEIRWFFDSASPRSSKDIDASKYRSESDAKSISILASLRSNKTLAKLCDTVRESDNKDGSHKFVA